MKKIAVIIRNSRQFDAIRDESIKRKYNWADGSDGIESLKFDPDQSNLEYFIFDPVRTVRYDGCYDSSLKGCLIIEFDEWSLLTGVQVVNEVIVEIGTQRTAFVTLDAIQFTDNTQYFTITAANLEEIYTAYKSLQS